MVAVTYVDAMRRVESAVVHRALVDVSWGDHLRGVQPVKVALRKSLASGTDAWLLALSGDSFRFVLTVANVVSGLVVDHAAVLRLGHLRLSELACDGFVGRRWVLLVDKCLLVRGIYHCLFLLLNFQFHLVFIFIFI